jgi:large subunit ribosomal protein L31
MKKSIHPNWNNDAVVTCACGNTFTTGSSFPTLTVDICSACHPFFTGEMKFVDTQGRVDKFMQKMQNAQTRQASAKTKKAAKAKNQADPKSYRQLLQEQSNAVKAAAKAA